MGSDGRFDGWYLNLERAVGIAATAVSAVEGKKLKASWDAATSPQEQMMGVLLAPPGVAVELRPYVLALRYAMASPQRQVVGEGNLPASQLGDCQIELNWGIRGYLAYVRTAKSLGLQPVGGNLKLAVERVLRLAEVDALTPHPKRQIDPQRSQALLKKNKLGNFGRNDPGTFREWFAEVFDVPEGPDPLPPIRGTGCYEVLWTVLTGESMTASSGAKLSDHDGATDSFADDAFHDELDSSE